MVDEGEYVLVPAESLPTKTSPYMIVLEEFVSSEYTLSYIQFDELQKLVKVYNGLKWAINKKKVDVIVIRKGKLLRIYLEKIIPV